MKASPLFRYCARLCALLYLLAAGLVPLADASLPQPGTTSPFVAASARDTGDRPPAEPGHDEDSCRLCSIVRTPVESPFSLEFSHFECRDSESIAAIEELELPQRFSFATLSRAPPTLS